MKNNLENIKINRENTEINPEAKEQTRITAFKEQKSKSLETLSALFEKYNDLLNKYEHKKSNTDTSINLLIQPYIDSGIQKDNAIDMYNKSRKGDYIDKDHLKNLEQVVNKLGDLILDIEIKKDELNKITYESYIKAKRLAVENPFDLESINYSINDPDFTYYLNYLEQKINS